MSRSFEDEGAYTLILEDLDVPDATCPEGFDRPNLTTFCRLDELGLVVTCQRVELDQAVLACRVAEPDRWPPLRLPGQPA